MTQSDILIVGAGLSGLLAAAAMADPQHGARRIVRLIDAGPITRAGQDGRATTLTPAALRALARLQIELPEMAALTGMRVGEGDAHSPWTFELGTAPAMTRPELTSDKAQPLAYVVENAALRQALLARIAQLPIICESGLSVQDVSREGRIVATLENGETREADLALACDGRNSAMRRLFGLAVTAHDYGQKALVTTVYHDAPHDGVALQRFQTVGAIASLPLPNDKPKKGRAPYRSQIIWSDRTASIDAASQLPEGTLCALIDERLWHTLNITGLAAPVQSYPLSAQRVEALSAPRLALIGDAARTIHPLAGQGFNLAIRDIAALTEGVKSAVATGQDIGTSGLIGYERWRRTDETLLGLTTAALSASPKRGPARLLGHLRRGGFALFDAAPLFHPLIRLEAAGELGPQPELLT